MKNISSEKTLPDGGKTPWGVLFILLIIALLIRLIYLFRLDVWFDEVAVLLLLENSYAEIWNLCKSDNFPPLVPWLYKFWASLFPGEKSLRLASALMGSLVPPVAFLLGRELLDKRLGWLLGIACAISFSMVMYSQMIRMYAIFPFFACISLLYFLRALRSNSFMDWLIVALANLLGFYTFLFMVFLIGFEGLLALWHYRRNLRSLLYGFITHLPVSVLMLFWLIPMLQRMSIIQGGFALLPVQPEDILKIWVFLGTGTYFSDRYWLAGLLNLPLSIGFVLGIVRYWDNQRIRYVTLIFLAIIVTVYLISYFGQSIFLKRYFLFILPIYLGVGLAGWLSLNSRQLRVVGLVTTAFVLIFSLSYYYLNYNLEHESYGFCVPFQTDEEGEGHAISEVSQYVAEGISENEVIIHFSNPSLRNLSFFPSIYYHGRSLPEYIYSKTGVRHWAGAQYLKSDELLEGLGQLDPLPEGIWLVTLDPSGGFFDPEVIFSRDDFYRWIYPDNLPQEMYEAGYRVNTIFRRGTVTAIHLRINESS